MVQAFDLGEGRLEAVPLWFELLPAYSLGEGGFERAIVVPELKLFKGGTAGEELDGFYEYDGGSRS